MRAVAHDGADVAVQTVPFRNPAFPITEVVVRAASCQPLWSLVEIRAAWAAAAEIVSLEPIGDAHGFVVRLEGREYRVGGNTSDSPIVVPPLEGMADGVLFVSGVNSPRDTIAAPLRLEPHQTAVWVRHPLPDERLPGWESFQQIVASEQPTAPGPP